MIKKPKNFSPSFPAELSDINEQELAKDTCTDTKSFFEEKTGRDSSDKCGESLPENISLSCSLPPKKELPRLESGENDTKEKEQLCSPSLRRGSGGAIYIAIMVICLFTGIAAVFLSVFANDPSSQLPADTQTPPSSDNSVTNPSLQGAQEIYKRGVQSTVTVISEKNGELCNFSGFCIFDGFVATVSDAALGERVRVICADGSSYPSSVRASLPELGLALLQTDAPLVAAELGNCSSLVENDKIYTISGASSEKCDLSLLCGNVSLSIRIMSIINADKTERRANVLQIRNIYSGAASGSPVFNSDGKIVAMAVNIENSSTDDCFALPIDTSLPVFECMRDGVSPSVEIMSAVAYSPAHLGILGVNTQRNEIFGVEIREFTKENCDASRFLRVGDLIYKVDNTAISDTQTLITEIENRMSSDTVEVFVIRDSQKLSFDLKLY